jgi:hypothetical protein
LTAAAVTQAIHGSGAVHGAGLETVAERCRALTIGDFRFETGARPSEKDEKAGPKPPHCIACAAPEGNRNGGGASLGRLIGVFVGLFGMCVMHLVLEEKERAAWLGEWVDGWMGGRI